MTYDEVFRFLSDKNRWYAEECTDGRKRVIQKGSENVCLEDGALFYLQYEYKEKQMMKSKQQ